MDEWIFSHRETIDFAVRAGMVALVAYGVTAAFRKLGPALRAAWIIISTPEDSE